jgi:hypothetical protein
MLHILAALFTCQDVNLYVLTNLNPHLDNMEERYRPHNIPNPTHVPAVMTAFRQQQML